MLSAHASRRQRGRVLPRRGVWCLHWRVLLSTFEIDARTFSVGAFAIHRSTILSFSLGPHMVAASGGAFGYGRGRNDLYLWPNDKRLRRLPIGDFNRKYRWRAGSRTD